MNCVSITYPIFIHIQFFYELRTVLPSIPIITNCDVFFSSPALHFKLDMLPVSADETHFLSICCREQMQSIVIVVY